MGERIKIYDEHKRPLGTALLEREEDAPHGRSTTLDGFPVRGSSASGDGWIIYQVRWFDKNTGEYHQPIYVKDE
jgi:hypothetical protein